MRTGSFGLVICLVSFVMICVTASAEDLKPEWLVRKWQGTLVPSNGRPVGTEMNFKSDGSCEGGVASANAAYVTYQNCKWSIAGDTVTLQYLVDTPARGGRFTSESTWTLKRNGDDLAGSGFRKYDSVQFGISLQPQK